MASRESKKTARDNKKTPNKRERLSAQYGQLNDIVSSEWNGNPVTLKEAINRIAADLAALKAKLDEDEGVFDEDYSTFKP